MELRMDSLKDLERQFSPSKWSKRYTAEEAIAKHIEFVTQASIEAKQSIPCQLNISYGIKEEEKLDIFGTHLPDDAPVFVYVHGGYWQQLNRDISSYVAKPLVKCGFKVIIVGYTLCPNVTIYKIIKQIESAVLKSIDYAKHHRSKTIHLCGHSAGAHLIASLFQSFVHSLPPSDQKLLKKIFLISGIYDLTLLPYTYINKSLGLDKISAQELSPLLQPISIAKAIRIYVIVAQADTPVFKKQSKSFYQKLHSLNCTSTFIYLKGMDHFNIVENLNKENYKLVSFIKN